MVLSSFSVFLAALNFSLSITAFLGNVVILFALRKVNSNGMEFFSEYGSYNSLSESSELFTTYKAVKTWTIDST